MYFDHIHLLYSLISLPLLIIDPLPLSNSLYICMCEGGGGSEMEGGGGRERESERVPKWVLH